MVEKVSVFFILLAFLMLFLSAYSFRVFVEADSVMRKKDRLLLSIPLLLTLSLSLNCVTLLLYMFLDYRYVVVMTPDTSPRTACFALLVPYYFF